MLYEQKGGFESGKRCGLGFLRNNRIAARAKQRFNRNEVYFLLLALLLVVVSMPIHESGHGLACMYLGLEILRFDLIGAKVNCTLVPGGPHLLALLAGGALPAVLFSVPLALGRVRKAKYVRLALITAITAQAANAILETLTYEAYIFYDLANLIALGAFGMILAIIFCGSLREPPAGRPDPKRDDRH